MDAIKEQVSILLDKAIRSLLCKSHAKEGMINVSIIKDVKKMDAINDQASIPLIKQQESIVHHMLRKEW